MLYKEQFDKFFISGISFQLVGLTTHLNKQELQMNHCFLFGFLSKLSQSAYTEYFTQDIEVSIYTQ